MLFGSAFIALFVPWRFVFRWAARLLVWGGLGPWMRIIDLFFHEEADLQKEKASRKAMTWFHEQHKLAKCLREQAIKVRTSRHQMCQCD